jgi:putative CocE/NonD family hydrolase
LGPNYIYAREGFIFVYQDVRGKFKSEGEFIVMQPHRTVKRSIKDTDESSDTYDTIEWLLKNIPNHNARVGQWGVSYPGWETVMGMIDAHPALKASSPQASPSDMWIGDDFHHNGAFRLMYTFGWLSSNAQIRSNFSEKRTAAFEYGTPDGYKFFLDLGPVSNIDEKYFHNSVPTWNEYMEHGNYDEYWHKQNVLQYLNNIKHPILNVAGWFDAEDFYGPMSIYYTIEKKNPDNRSIIVVGPWSHGGWTGGDGDLLGNIKFDLKTGVYFRENVEFPFFNYYLKDKGQPNLPEAIVFETGLNQWKSYDQWPPKETKEKNLYFHTNGNLTPEEKVKNLHQLIATYSSRSEIFYLDSDNHFLPIFEHFKNSSAINLIPRFDKKEILDLVQKGILLPFGVTRFIVPNRVLGLEISCLVLSAQTPLSEKNLFLKELLAYRIKTKKAKFYQESVTLFNE